MKVDLQTLQKYESVYEKQRTTNNYKLLGIWRVTFAANKKTDLPNDGYYAIGETVFVSIKRGATIDFICTSFIGDFGGMSDQGPTHSINFNGTSFWSFPVDSKDGIFHGQLNGVLGSIGKADAVLSSSGNQLIIHEYPEPDDEGRIVTTQQIIGGPISQTLEKGGVATVFFERRFR
jgi:hypothetical protein